MSPPRLARLYDVHAPGLHRFLLSLTGCESDARDLLQDLFVKLARRPETEVLRDEQAYLFRAARNLATDLLRRKIRGRRVMETLSQDPEWFVPICPDFPPGELRRAAAALMKLSEDQRAVVHLKLWENLTFARIAEVLAIPANTAASRYRYALDKLRAALQSTPTAPCHER